ncbi:dihydrolipoamide acetyltransferase family protein [Spelaeicoccus albus]|uniref:Dihydrolipoamide acetyltransferase component of pyruvate dehydrogenase complex n=1 Tax=Spelaeicoccus albus TaxID=1280376 RepID=A0A7Z0CZM0_9MICO|nr:dihydrolipoamide acetyltransferase family protein [Spelaeicoccus albus]NYI66384.1 pyruvate dehydrogenase E2 component (dihydrolipoamide acetyltransferase) [Spelaeicoccus albus]
MAEIFALPDVGEGLTEAEIVSWKVKPGDTVGVNQVFVEIETAKSLVELPSPHAGVIGELLVNEGQTVEVGSPIVSFVTDGADAPSGDGSASGSAGAAAPASEDDGTGATLVGYGSKPGARTRRARKASSAAPAAESAEQKPAAAAVPAAPAAPAPVEAAAVPVRSGHALAKPPVRKLAKDLGLDLAALTPTGANGEVTRADVNAAAGAAAGDDAQTGAGTASGVKPAPAAARGERETRIPVKSVRKMTAQAMVKSAFTAPHVSLFLDVDVTRTMEFVAELKASKALGEDTRVSPLLILAKAVTWAVKRNPTTNSVFSDDEIVIKNYVNLGIAAATPRGLIVPNIKDADVMNLTELGSAIGDLVSVARSGKTPPSDQTGGTITITNVGVFGVDTGTPIINPGESAIVAFGQIRKRPWVVGDEVVPRDVTTLGLSADHRVIDGDVASKFLADLGRALEQPAILLS